MNPLGVLHPFQTQHPFVSDPSSVALSFSLPLDKQRRLNVSLTEGASFLRGDCEPLFLSGERDAEPAEINVPSRLPGSPPRPEFTRYRTAPTRRLHTQWHLRASANPAAARREVRRPLFLPDVTRSGQIGSRAGIGSRDRRGAGPGGRSLLPRDPGRRGRVCGLRPPVERTGARRAASGEAPDKTGVTPGLLQDYIYGP